VYSLAHVNSAISSGLTGGVSAPVVSASSSIATLSIANFVVSQGFPQNGKIATDLDQALLTALSVGQAKSGQRRAEGPPLGWIKVGLDFLCRSRLIQTTLGATYKLLTIPAFGYANNEDHRLVELWE
jgi:hypothetical protein